MRLLNCLLVLTTSVIFLSPVSFANTITKQAHDPVVFQVIQDQLNIDNSVIKDASIITNSDGSYGGLQINLNSAASKELTRITTAGIGKVANIVLNNKIVSSATLQSSLQHQFLVTSIKKEDAQMFIDSLKKN